MDEDSIAYVLEMSYRGCAGMTGQDVVELFGFLLANPRLPRNPISYWIDILNRQMDQPDERRLVDLAILRFGRKSRLARTEELFSPVEPPARCYNIKSES